ncbi:hypothetical protein PVAP13_5KG779200 [Panicum virgatum]|uniref:Secreted protein n=1 Tax=Panicum virgatum TaxID=38727 RepID=A0A8T0T5P3_PANVG|nr:hypothetical protein PVAP13_5KG779200 [Panicum virgatum]
MGQKGTHLLLAFRVVLSFKVLAVEKIEYRCFHGREKYKDQEPSASNLFECLYRKKRNDTPYVQIVIAC